MKLRNALLAGALAVTLAACGGSDSDAEQVIADGQASVDAAVDNAQDSLDEAQDAAEELIDDVTNDDGTIDEDALDEQLDSLAESAEAAQQAFGGGNATLTVGDMTWNFDSIVCAVGEDQIGQEGAVLSVSSIQDGTQFYVSIDEFGEYVSLNDIEDFENPSVSVGSDFSASDFIEFDGQNFSGEVGFIDDTSDSFETIPGSFSGTCP